MLTNTEDIKNDALALVKVVIQTAGALVDELLVSPPHDSPGGIAKLRRERSETIRNLTETAQMALRIAQTIGPSSPYRAGG